MSAAIVLALLGLAAPEPPEVRYVVSVQTASWEPIDLPEVERMVEQAVTEPLTTPGKMRLSKATPLTLSEGPYVLRVSGRFVEEAERFTVYLSFGPGTQADLPSLVAAHTSGTRPSRPPRGWPRRSGRGWTRPGSTCPRHPCRTNGSPWGGAT